MKLFKKIVILSAIVLSLGSSVAFGDCPQTKSTGTQIDATKQLNDSGSQKDDTTTTTKSGQGN